MRLSVIIVNYNVRFFLEQCLYSVQKALQGLVAEILVVDNASTDGSREYLEPRFPAVRFFWNRDNAGFAKANNLALSKAKGEYILYLNPDTIVPEDAFSLCLAYLDTHSNVGALGVRMLDGSGKFLKESKRAFPSPGTAFFKLTGLASLFPASPVFARYHLGHLEEMKTQEADVLSGAFMMSRKTILDSNNGFDESFFMYGEDIDLSYRIKQAGYINVYFADTTIIHFKGESTKKGSLKYVKTFYSAMAIFVRKHYGGAGAGIFLFFIQMAIRFRALLSITYTFFKPLRLTIADTAAIFGSFALTNFVLDQFASASTGYPPLFSIKAPLFYIISWFIFSRFTKPYAVPKKKKSLFRNLLITTATALIAASWLPDELSISHISVLSASAVFYIFSVFYRWLLFRSGVLQHTNNDHNSSTVVVGSVDSFIKIQNRYGNRQQSDLLTGRVSINKGSDGVCTLEQLNDYITNKNITTVIYCENGFSFKQIIESVDGLKKRSRIRIHAFGSGSIVGSDTKDEMGETISV